MAALMVFFFYPCLMHAIHRRDLIHSDNQVGDKNSEDVWELAPPFGFQLLCSLG